MKAYWKHIGVTISCIVAVSGRLAFSQVLLYDAFSDETNEAQLTEVLATASVSVLDVGDISMLALGNVVLMPEQSHGTVTELQSIGSDWTSVIQTWVANGGVVIQLDGFDSRYLLPAAGLIALDDAQDVSNGTVTISDPSDPLAVGLPSIYTAEFDSVSYSSPDGTVVVRDASNRAVVINKPYGLGNVVIIGHDFSTSNPAMETLLINAVTRLPATVGGLSVTSSGLFEAEGYEGGPFAGSTQTLTVTNGSGADQTFTVTSSQSWLSASPSSGTLLAGESAAVVVSLDSSATSLPAGGYSATIEIANTTTPSSRILLAHLQINGVAHLPFSDGFESGTFQPVWRMTGTGDAATTATMSDLPHTGAHHAVLTNANTGVTSRNELTLTVDLSQAEDVSLSFAAKDFSPLTKGRDKSAADQMGFDLLLEGSERLQTEWESFQASADEQTDLRRAFLSSIKSAEQAPTNPVVGGADTDALLISADGTTWYEIFDFRTSVGQVYDTYTVDLDAAIGRYGLGYSDRFRIRFNHVGRFGIPADGIAIDDVSIVSNGVRAIASENAAPSATYSVWETGDNGGYGFDAWSLITQTSGVGSTASHSVASAASVGGSASLMDTNGACFIMATSVPDGSSAGATAVADRPIAASVAQADREHLRMRMQAVQSGFTNFNNNVLNVNDSSGNTFFRFGFRPGDTSWMIRQPGTGTYDSTGVPIDEPISLDLELDNLGRGFLVSVSSLTSGASYGPTFHAFVDTPAPASGFPRTLSFASGRHTNGPTGLMALLINGLSIELLGSEDGLVVSPLSDPDFAGQAGGPFAPGSFDFSVTNTSSAVVSVTTSANVDFLNVNPDVMSLLPGQSKAVSVSPNNNANGLLPGIHNGTISISNESTMSVRRRDVRVGVGTRRVLAYTQFADKREEVANSRSALDILSTNYFWQTVDFANEAIDQLPHTDVLLIPDQDQGGALFAVGQELQSPLETWIQNGGVVVQCSEPSTWQILDGAGLLNIVSAVDASGASINLSNAADPIAQGVAPYTAESHSAAFTTSVTGIVLETAGGQPVALNKKYGAGNVVAIGHDYETSNLNQDRVLANAVFELPAGENLEVSGDDPSFVGFAGEGFGASRVLTLRNLGSGDVSWTADSSAAWLSLLPTSGVIGAGSTQSVSVEPNSDALLLAPGRYTATLTIMDDTTFAIQTRDVALFVRDTATIPFFDGFEASELTPVWYATGGGPYSAGPTTISATSGAQSLGLGSAIAFSYARSEATLALGVHGRENTLLAFRARSLGETPNAPISSPFIRSSNFDGVAISADEVTWYEVQELRRTLSDADFVDYSVNLDAAMSRVGIGNEGRLFVRFNQFGNRLVGDGGGILLDDVTVTAGISNDLLVGFGSLEFDGPSGGPFSPPNRSIVVSNTSSASRDWAAAATVSWITVGPANGTLNPGESVTLNVQPTVTAASLTDGFYNGQITVTDTTNSVVHERSIILQVAPRRVAVYTEFSDRFVEVPRALDAVRTIDPHFIASEVESAGALPATLATSDVLYIPEVVFADDFTLRGIGGEIGSDLASFLGGGNTIVLSTGASGFGSGLRTLEQAGLIQPTSTTTLPVGAPVTIGVSSDPIADSVSDYATTKRSVVFSGNVGTAIATADGAPVVVRIDLMGGHVILIGHSYWESGTSENQILHNAFFFTVPPAQIADWYLLED